MWGGGAGRGEPVWPGVVLPYGRAEAATGLWGRGHHSDAVAGSCRLLWYSCVRMHIM